MNKLDIYRLSLLRKIVSNLVILYKIWFYLIRKKRGDKVRLPKSGDHIYFDGYPRSGNTYFSGLIKSAFPDFRFSSHLHSISGIKIARKKKVKTFIIIRNPKEVIASNMFRVMNDKNYTPNQNLADSLLKSYVKYYKYVSENANDINMIDFEKSIKDQKYFLNSITKILGLTDFNEAQLEGLILENNREMADREKYKRKETSALPSNQRENFKKNNYNLILASDYYEKAMELYHQLIKY